MAEVWQQIEALDAGNKAEKDKERQKKQQELDDYIDALAPPMKCATRHTTLHYTKHHTESTRAEVVRAYVYARLNGMPYTHQ